MLKVKEMFFPIEEHTNWLPDQMVIPEHIHTSGIIQAEQVIFKNMSYSTYMNAMKINGKKQS